MVQRVYGTGSWCVMQTDIVQLFSCMYTVYVVVCEVELCILQIRVICYAECSYNHSETEAVSVTQRLALDILHLVQLIVIPVQVCALHVYMILCT